MQGGLAGIIQFDKVTMKREDVETDSEESLIAEEYRLQNIEDNRRFLAELGLPSPVKVILRSNVRKEKLKSQVEDHQVREKKRPRYVEGPHSHQRQCCTKPLFTSDEILAGDSSSEDAVPDVQINVYIPKAQRRSMRVLSLFDGIGTGFVALKQLGIEVEVYYTAETDKNAQLVTLGNHSVSCLGDVLQIDQKKIMEICPIDLVLAGPPCYDLSIVNPNRQGFNGSGKLIFKFLSILKQIEAVCSDSHTVFWLMENTGHMQKEYLDILNNIIGRKPVRVNAKRYSGQRRARNFWGNIPEMRDINRRDVSGDDLDSVMFSPERKAMVLYSRTITTCKNSLSITNGIYGGLVTMNGTQCDIWLQEIERLFGFPQSYTDKGNLSADDRRVLLGRAWSVPVIKHILSPLRNYYKTRQE